MPLYNKPKRIKIRTLIIILSGRYNIDVTGEDESDMAAVDLLIAQLLLTDGLMATSALNWTTPQQDAWDAIETAYTTVSDGCTTGDVETLTADIETKLGAI